MLQNFIYLSIGGINVSLARPDFEEKKIVKPPYRNFVVAGPRKPACRPDSIGTGRVDLQVIPHIDSIPEPSNKQKVFNASDAWNLFYARGKYYYQDNDQDVLSVREAVIQKDFRRATVYCSRYWAVKAGLVNRLFDIPLGQFLISSILADKNGLILHACGVKYRNKGFIFMGPSGSGKSTLARLWRGVKGAVVLSDERIILRLPRFSRREKTTSRFLIYGTPWSGRDFASANQSAPLKGIYLIRHSPENFIEPADSEEALSTFLTNIRFPLWDKNKTGKVLGLTNTILSSVPVFKLGFVPTRKAINLILSSLWKSNV